jgi:protein required for attachment to host cells
LGCIVGPRGPFLKAWRPAGPERLQRVFRAVGTRRKTIPARLGPRCPAPAARLRNGRLRAAFWSRRAAEGRSLDPDQGENRGPGASSTGTARESGMSAIKLEHDLWVLVADGEKALFLRNEGDAQYPNLQVVREEHHDNPPTREQGTDRPGRLNDASGEHRSAVADTDWHRIEKDRFADEIAERLYKMAHKGTFKKLVLVAQPQVLGEMRKKLHKEVADKVTGEVAKTLTNHTVPEIEKVLAGG